MPTTSNTITDYELGTDTIGVDAVDGLTFTSNGDNTIIGFGDSQLAELLNVSPEALQADGLFAFA